MISKLLKPSLFRRLFFLQMLVILSGDWLIMAMTSDDGKVWVVVGQTRAFFGQLDRKLIRQAFVVPLVYAVVLLLALWVAAWQGLRPLCSLVCSAREMCSPMC